MGDAVNSRSVTRVDETSAPAVPQMKQEETGRCSDPVPLVAGRRDLSIG